MEKDEKDGVGNANSDGTGGNSEGKKDVVAFETYDKLLNQRKKDKERLSKLEEELKARESKDKEAEEKRLQENEEWKKLAEAKAQELEKERAEKEEYKSSLINGAKLQAFVDKLPSKLANNDYLSFVPLDKIALDPETKTVDESSLNLVVNDFLEKHSRLLAKNSNTKLPNDSGNKTSKLSYEAWLKLPLKEQKDRMHEVMNRK